LESGEMTCSEWPFVWSELAVMGVGYDVAGDWVVMEEVGVDMDPWADVMA